MRLARHDIGALKYYAEAINPAGAGDNEQQLKGLVGVAEWRSCGT